MPQIKEEICSWVALGRLVGFLAEQEGERPAGEGMAAQSLLSRGPES